MRNLSTLTWGLLAAALLPVATLHAQSLAPQEALAKALATRTQWADPAADVRLSSAYADANGLEHIYVQQQYRGIPVYNHLQTLAFVGSRLASHAGTFVPAKQLAALAATPTLDASQAVSLALQHVAEGAIGTPARLTTDGGSEARQTFAGAGVARRDIVASLTWVVDKANQPHLAWNVNVEMLATPDWWNVQVDALTGAIISQDNWTVQEVASRPVASYVQAHYAQAARQLPPPPPTTTTSGYYVVPFPKENPNGGFQLETDPWLKAGTANNATTYGWHFDGTTNYAATRGNNVSAYDDQAAANAPGNYAPSLTAAPALSFNYPSDFTTTPKSVPNRNSAVTNLFYWNNIIHDITYQYGFTEAAGNYQTDNMGRGGLGGDYVKAEAQDGGGTNNANFSAPPDGTSGRMQMYLWDAAKPAYSITVTSPSSVAGSYPAVEGNLSTNNSLSVKGPISGQLQLYVDGGGATTNLACVAAAAGSLTGKIALLYRGGTCTFAVKVKNAQNAGAIAAIVINNAAGAPIAMTGTDNTITIPAVMISQANGAALVAQLANNVQATLPQAPAVPQIDGDFDNGVVTHEFGHGVSLRLTGGPANSSCLSNAEQGGEGWSDYLALMLTTDWSTAQLTDGTKARPVGTYVFGQAATGSGIRRYPYSTSLSTNPLTYANVAANPEVHAIGEIWCAALWDMTWNIIQQRSAIGPNLYNGAGTGGNNIALQLVLQGMKLQTCQPGFLDARDAILAADSVLYQGQYHCAIWSAFARRGMGYSALEGSANIATDQTAAFDLPPSVSLVRQEVLLTGTTYNISFKLTSNCQTPGTPYTLTDALPTGMQFVSSTGGVLSGNTVTFSNITFTAPGQTKTFSFLAQALSSAACPGTLVVTDNRDGSKTGGFASTTLTGTTTWSTSAAHAYSPTNAWYAPSLTTVSDYVLTSAPFTPTGLSTLSFYHYFDFEATYDGGTVELSSNNGTTWQDAGPYFVQGGYNSSFDASTTAPGQACFSGRSVLGATRFIHSVLDLRSFVGTPLRLRFRVRTDNGTPFTYEGWFVDDIWVLNGCGGNQQVELRTSTGTLVASQPLITYLLSSPLAQKAALADASAFTASPNPFGPQGLQLQLTLPAAQANLAFTVYDVTGRVLLRRDVAQLAAGTSTLTWPEAASLPAGLYLVRLQLPDGSSSTLRVERE